MTRIKICGLTREEDVRAVNEAMPDYVGFVFADSRRRVTPAKAARLAERLDPAVRRVGVFVREPLETVAALLESGLLHMAQLHGGEDASYIARLRALTGKPLIQAFAIGCEADARRAEASGADWILLDNGSGGTGSAFDWRLTDGITRPFFLAGGLTPANLTEAVRQTHPFAVDLSSGVEIGGRKDPDKIREAVRRIRDV